jgi:AraC family transcriptional regulator
MTIMQLSSEELGVRAVAELSAIIEQPTVVPKCTKTTPWQVRCVQAHIAANMQAAIRTADLAGIVGFSSYRIKCVFKDNFGCTPHQYLIRRRVARAQRLLVMSDDP